MSDLNALNLIIQTLSTWSGAVLVIVTAVIAIGLGYLVYLFGWRKTQTSLGFDFAKADELEEFFSRRGRNNAPWDWSRMHNK